MASDSELHEALGGRGRLGSQDERAGVVAGLERSGRLMAAAEAARRAEQSRIASLRAAELSRSVPVGIRSGAGEAAPHERERRSTSTSRYRVSERPLEVSAVRAGGSLSTPAWSSPVSRVVPGMGGRRREAAAGRGGASHSLSRDDDSERYAHQYGAASYERTEQGRDGRHPRKLHGPDGSFGSDYATPFSHAGTYPDDGFGAEHATHASRYPGGERQPVLSRREDSGERSSHRQGRYPNADQSPSPELSGRHGGGHHEHPPPTGDRLGGRHHPEAPHGPGGSPGHHAPHWRLDPDEPSTPPYGSGPRLPGSGPRFRDRLALAEAEAEAAAGASGRSRGWGGAAAPGDAGGSPALHTPGEAFASPAVAMARDEGHRATAAMLRRAVAALEAEVRALKTTLQRERTEAAAEAARRSDAEAGIRRQLMDSQAKVTELGAASHAASRAAAKAERRAESAEAEAEAAAAEAARRSDALLRRAEEAEARAARLGAAGERTGEDLQAALREATAERRRTEAALTEAAACREAREAAEDARKKEAVEAEAARAELSRLRGAETATLLELRAEVRRLTSAEQAWRQRASDAEEAAAEARAELARAELARATPVPGAGSAAAAVRGWDGGASGGLAARLGGEAPAPAPAWRGPLDDGRSGTAPTASAGPWHRASQGDGGHGGYGGEAQGGPWMGSPERPSRPPLASESGWRSPQQLRRSDMAGSADLSSSGAARALDGLRGRGRV